MPLAMAKSVIDTFSTTLARADGVSRAASSMPGSADARISATSTPISVACVAGSCTWAETRQTTPRRDRGERHPVCGAQRCCRVLIGRWRGARSVAIAGRVRVQEPARD